MTCEYYNPLKPTVNKKLPFFAYGTFKPGQLAYSRINDCVKNKCECEINYKMLMRDGVPLITPTNDGSHFKTKGYLIYFTDERAYKAYKIISNTHNKNLYKWEEIKVGETKANVLMGVDSYSGSYSIRGNVGNYEGQNDPYFKNAIEVVEKELNDVDKIEDDIDIFFKLQMAYLLLWTVIERYCSLKYNCKGIVDKWRELSNEDVFKDSFKEHVKSKRYVYSNDYLKKCKLYPGKSSISFYYYYTIRCNTVHRGKDGLIDNEIIKQSLKELLEIFKEVLDKAFDDNFQ